MIDAQLRLGIDVDAHHDERGRGGQRPADLIALRVEQRERGGTVVGGGLAGHVDLDARRGHALQQRRRAGHQHLRGIGARDVIPQIALHVASELDVDRHIA